MPLARSMRRLKTLCTTGRLPKRRTFCYLFCYLATLIVSCGSMALLAGCGGGSSSSLGNATLPVTSGTRLLFDTFGFGAGTNTFTAGIDTLAPDGSNLQNVVNDASATMPRFSADGNKLVYEAGSGISFLVVANADGSNPVVVSSTDNSFPALRPDGKVIVFSGNFGALYTKNIDGAQLRKIYTPQTGYSADRPIYAPDGNHILFEQDSNLSNTGTSKIYLIDADGSGRRQVGLDSGVTPAISPDGKRIAYGVTSASTQGLYLSNSDGTGQPTRLISSAASLPAFSPDGTRIAYLKLVDSSAFINGSPTYEIHIINTDGTGDRLVSTKLAVATSSLDWR